MVPCMVLLPDCSPAVVAPGGRCLSELHPVARAQSKGEFAAFGRAGARWPVRRAAPFSAFSARDKRAFPENKAVAKQAARLARRPPDHDPQRASDVQFRSRRDRGRDSRDRAAFSQPTRSRRAPPRSTGATSFRAISGRRSARSACTASPSRRNMAAPGSAISSTASRWRRSRAPRRRSACPMARIPISASTRSAATATRRRSGNICRN